MLFEIDPRPYQADLARAQAELEQARTGAELGRSERSSGRSGWWHVQAHLAGRVRQPHQRGSPQSVAAVRAAEAAVPTARLNLEWTTVRSPIAGRVSGAEVTAGNLVQAGPPTATLLTTVVSLDPIYVYFEGDEQTYLKYAELARNGGAAKLRDVTGLRSTLGLAERGRAFPTRATSTSSTTSSTPRPAPFGLARSSPTRTAASRPASSPGSSWSAAAEVPRPRWCRTRAIGTDQDKKFVLVLKPDSTVEYRPVEARPDRRRTPRRRLGGLKPGEQIVINGLQRVRPGMKVIATEGHGPDSTSPTPWLTH